MKRCTICGVTKHFQDFYRCSRIKDGYGYNCRLCLREIFKRRDRSSRRWPCSGCGGLKPPGQGKQFCDSCLEKRVTANKDRGKLYKQHYRALHPTHERDRMTWRRYRLPKEDYDRLLTAQQFRCAICSGGIAHHEGKRKSVRAATVDHLHGTNITRGILCRRCNVGLHYLENMQWRTMAEAYLRKCPPSLLKGGTDQ